MTFGQRLRFARKEKQLTQKELAAKIKAAHNSISNWENDQNMPDPETIQNLCWALDVLPNYFFDIASPDPQIKETSLPEGLSDVKLELIEEILSADDADLADLVSYLKVKKGITRSDDSPF